MTWGSGTSTTTLSSKNQSLAKTKSDGRTLNRWWGTKAISPSNTRRARTSSTQRRPKDWNINSSSQSRSIRLCGEMRIWTLTKILFRCSTVKAMGIKGKSANRKANFRFKRKAKHRRSKGIYRIQPIWTIATKTFRKLHIPTIWRSMSCKDSTSLPKPRNCSWLGKASANKISKVLPPKSDNKVARLSLTRGSSMCKGNTFKTTVRRWLALATQSS